MRIIYFHLQRRTKVFGYCNCAKLQPLHVSVIIKETAYRHEQFQSGKLSYNLLKNKQVSTLEILFSSLGLCTKQCSRFWTRNVCIIFLLSTNRCRHLMLRSSPVSIVFCIIWSNTALIRRTVSYMHICILI